MELPKLSTFDFPVEFEAVTFTLVVDKAGDDPQHYAYLVQGWRPMLEAVARETYRPGAQHNDESVWLECCVQEVLEVVGDVEAWDQATTSDFKPFRCLWRTGPGTTGNGTPLVTVTILRLFENDLERVLLQHGFPGGQRPGEADEDGIEREAIPPEGLRALAEGRAYKPPGADPDDPLDVLVPAPKFAR